MVLVRKVVVNFDIKLPPCGLIEDGFVKVVLPRRRIGIGWLRIKIYDFLPHGINQSWVNHIWDGETGAVASRVYAKRVENGVERITEVTGALKGRGHECVDVERITLPKPLEINKEKCLAIFDRPPERKPILIAGVI